MERNPTSKTKPRQTPDQNCRNVNWDNNTRYYKPYSDPIIHNSNEINKDGYKSPKWVKRVERMASKKGEGRASKLTPRNKNSQKYQDFLQNKVNKVYSKYT